MSTENESAQIEKLKEAAKAHDKAAVESYAQLGKAAWELARHATEIHDKDLARYLGFASFDEWIAGRNMERSTCRMWVRRYQELSKSFKHSEIRGLSGQNADLLLRLPVKQRSEAMLNKATELKTPEFTKVVERTIQKSAPANEPAPELRDPLKIATSTSQKKFIDGAMADFAKKEKLETESPARILELMIAETIASELTDAQMLVAFLVPELRKAIDLIRDKEHDAEWRLTQVSIHLQRAFEAVLKPETILKRTKEDPVAPPTPEESIENAKQFFKGNGQSEAQKAVAEVPLKVMADELKSKPLRRPRGFDRAIN